MKRAKKSVNTRLLGRDAHGKPMSLQSKSVEGFDASDPIKKAQRQSKVQRGSMGKEPAATSTPKRKRRST